MYGTSRKIGGCFLATDQISFQYYELCCQAEASVRKDRKEQGISVTRIELKNTNASVPVAENMIPDDAPNHAGGT